MEKAQKDYVNLAHLYTEANETIKFLGLKLESWKSANERKIQKPDWSDTKYISSEWDSRMDSMQTKNKTLQQELLDEQLGNKRLIGLCKQYGILPIEPNKSGRDNDEQLHWGSTRQGDQRKPLRSHGRSMSAGHASRYASQAATSTSQTATQDFSSGSWRQGILSRGGSSGKHKGVSWQDQRTRDQ